MAHLLSPLRPLTWALPWSWLYYFSLPLSETYPALCFCEVCYSWWLQASWVRTWKSFTAKWWRCWTEGFWATGSHLDSEFGLISHEKQEILGEISSTTPTKARARQPFWKASQRRKHLSRLYFLPSLWNNIGSSKCTAIKMN